MRPTECVRTEATTKRRRGTEKDVGRMYLSICPPSLCHHHHHHHLCEIYIYIAWMVSGVASASPALGGLLRLLPVVVSIEERRAAVSSSRTLRRCIYVRGFGCIHPSIHLFIHLFIHSLFIDFVLPSFIHSWS
eukprot:GHVU01021246.1.p1 GENE.GHVU01021246.1~~GHVU01021246.1.p1  ORF type:complete len:133 (-),score=8.89 GHVU01021246.1:321-719(-)